jgi:hypothetical protein
MIDQVIDPAALALRRLLSDLDGDLAAFAYMGDDPAFDYIYKFDRCAG